MSAIPNGEHLKLIQDVITRQAGNSFLLKGWAVTLVGALLGWSVSERSVPLACVAAGVVVAFAALDAYYLMLERRFRRFYDAVAAGAAGIPGWSMNDRVVAQAGEYWAAFDSPVIWGLYGALLVAVAVMAILFGTAGG